MNRPRPYTSWVLTPEEQERLLQDTRAHLLREGDLVTCTHAEFWLRLGETYRVYSIGFNDYDETPQLGLFTLDGALIQGYFPIQWFRKEG